MRGNMAPPEEEAEALIQGSEISERTPSESSHDEPAPAVEKPAYGNSRRKTMLKLAAGIALGLVAIYWTLISLYNSFLASYLRHSAHPKFPYYFDPNPELWPGPTATGRAPFLAQATVAPSFGQAPNKTMERLWAHLSPYSLNYGGWGIEEYALPVGAKITQVHTLHRHGARYPTSGANVESLGSKMTTVAGRFNASGPLEFLNTWSYGLGAEIMVPAGRLQLFESGVHRYYQYGHLYEPGTKILVRSTTQKRMRESVWNFLSGFFGLEWQEYAEVGYGIEGFSNNARWNNSLAGYNNCPNSNKAQNKVGQNVSSAWQTKYLQNATARINNLVEGLVFETKDIYAMQTMCPYEFAAFGYSPFCKLFTFEEWEGFEYSIDLWFSGGSGFQSPTGRAVGLAWHQELLARLEHHTLSFSHSQINTTLDSTPETFPLNQTLYFDFSHDTNIMSILTSLGFSQFSALPADYPGPHNLTVSNITPFAGRLDVEVLTTPHPVREDRSYDPEGAETRYVRFKLNERTLPHPRCAPRKDGLCELGHLLEILRDEEGKVDYEVACYGDYEPAPWGAITDGRPLGLKD
ncbi:hypothetical protein HYFRA_00013194 [Hymenoscyphus fraxineus]|uniref:3-phytase n=1 Tax=Hymenoscyphus fraxineus TaxID=746836 RepID=A0A9N9PU92_9HELO|nr:hypothetical protein HYFRA_00013194 [Hymenoscyphus fraxineus]